MRIKKRAIYSIRFLVSLYVEALQSHFCGHIKSRFSSLNGQGQKKTVKKCSSIPYERIYNKTVLNCLLFPLLSIHSYMYDYTTPWFWLAGQYCGWIELLDPRKLTNVIRQHLCYQRGPGLAGHQTNMHTTSADRGGYWITFKIITQNHKSNTISQISFIQIVSII